MTWITLATDTQSSGVNFWGAVGLAAAIATALATAASTAVSVWWRYQDRTEAEWAVHVHQRGGMSSDGNRVAAPMVTMAVQNIGDGSAHKVCVTGAGLKKDPYVGRLISGSGSHPTLNQPVPVMRTGDEMFVGVEAESFDVWANAYVEVSWWPPPTRKTKDWGFVSRHKKQRFILADITDAPTDLPPIPDGDRAFF